MRSSVSPTGLIAPDPRAVRARGAVDGFRESGAAVAGRTPGSSPRMRSPESFPCLDRSVACQRGSIPVGRSVLLPGTVRVVGNGPRRQSFAEEAPKPLSKEPPTARIARSGLEFPAGSRCGGNCFQHRGVPQVQWDLAPHLDPLALNLDPRLGPPSGGLLDPWWWLLRPPAGSVCYDLYRLGFPGVPVVFLLHWSRSNLEPSVPGPHSPILQLGPPTWTPTWTPGLATWTPARFLPAFSPSLVVTRPGSGRSAAGRRTVVTKPSAMTNSGSGSPASAHWRIISTVPVPIRSMWPAS